MGKKSTWSDFFWFTSSLLSELHALFQKGYTSKEEFSVWYNIVEDSHSQGETAGSELILLIN